MCLVVGMRRFARQWLVAVLAIGAFVHCGEAQAQVKVSGYRRSNGTYVPSHYRSKPNGNFHDNWSTKGNRNPYTGEWGTRVTPPSGYGGGGYLPSSEYSGLRSDLSNGYSPAYGGSSRWEMSVIRGSTSPLDDEAEEAPGPPNPRPATIEESIVTGAVDGQVIDNPFVKQPRRKKSPQVAKPAR